MDPPRTQRSESMKFATEYAQIAMRGAFLINSGALVALPPLMSWLDVAGGRSGAGAALWFVCGLLLAAVSSIVAYANFLLLADLYDARWTKAAMDVNESYYPRQPGQPPVQMTEKYRDKVESEKRSGIWAEITRVVALLVGLASYGAFIGGAAAFRSLVGS